MGRPVNKRYFGSGTGNQLKARFKLAGTEYDGYVVAQRSTNKFKVSDGGSNTGFCVLVNKAAGALSNNEMTINLVKDDGTVVQATKLYNRVAIVEGNEKIKWNFSTSTSDSAAAATDVEDLLILVQPADSEETTGDPASFSVTIQDIAAGTTTYAWQVSTDSGSTWASATGGVYSGETSTTLAISDNTGLDGNMYRVVITNASAGNSPVTSASATLTEVAP